MRSSGDGHWYSEPAWLGLLLALLLHLAYVSYRFGELDSRVDILIQQHSQVLDLLLHHGYTAASK
jgi:hypothetical protein